MNGAAYGIISLEDMDLVQILQRSLSLLSHRAPSSAFMVSSGVEKGWSASVGGGKAEGWILELQVSTLCTTIQKRGRRSLRQNLIKLPISISIHEFVFEGL